MKQVHNYLDLSLTEINKLLKEKTITPKDLVLEAFERIEQNKDLNIPKFPDSLESKFFLPNPLIFHPLVPHKIYSLKYYPIEKISIP